ncbi:MAG: FkbM family methyltransferase [Pseudomonadota bacterium]
MSKQDILAAHRLEKTSQNSFDLLFDVAARMAASEQKELSLLDVGSYVGSFARGAISKLNDHPLSIYCFDAFQGNIETAKSLISEPFVEFINAAVTKEDLSEVTFSIPKQSFSDDHQNTWGGRVATDPTRQEFSQDEKIRVPGIALDTFLKQRNIERPDIVKMDIQGGEYEALLGMGAALRQTKLMFIECQLKHGRDMRYVELLQKNGFIVMMDTFQFGMHPDLNDEEVRMICDMVGIRIERMVGRNVYGSSTRGDFFLKCLSHRSPISGMFTYFQTDLLAANMRFGLAKIALYEALTTA